MDSCQVFAGRKCQVCSHRVEDHLHIKSETTVLRDDGDKSLRAKIQYYKTDAGKKQAHVECLESLIGEYQGEQKEIETTAALFGAFLRMNSVIPARDARLEYLDHHIKEEKGKTQAEGNPKSLASHQRTTFTSTHA